MINFYQRKFLVNPYFIMPDPDDPLVSLRVSGRNSWSRICNLQIVLFAEMRVPLRRVLHGNPPKRVP